MTVAWSQSAEVHDIQAVVPNPPLQVCHVLLPSTSQRIWRRYPELVLYMFVHEEWRSQSRFPDNQDIWTGQVDDPYHGK